MATWLVLHNKNSVYDDTIGKTYVYPIGIPNSRQIKVGDLIVFCLTKKSAPDDRRILGYGLIDELELRPPLENDSKKRNQYAAHLVDYKKFEPALSFKDIGGDPRTNWTNSINRIEIGFDKYPSKKNYSTANENHSTANENYSTINEKYSIPNDDFSNKQYYARRIRRGQPKFRTELLKEYDSSCAICGHGPENVLEACHILPHNKSGNNQLENGLLLRSDFHNLFDDELLKINPETYRIELAPSLLNTPYKIFDGQKLRTRLDGKWPSKEYLRLKYKANSKKVL